MRKLKIVPKILFVLFLLIISVNSALAQSVPLTLAGEVAGCSVYPQDVYCFEPGEKINLVEEDSAFNIFVATSGCGVDYYIGETFGSYKATHEDEYIVVNRYGGCDFSDYYLKPFSNGVPDFFEGCPVGYYEYAGSCAPTKETMLSNQEQHCDNLGGYWYNDECNDNSNLIQETQEKTIDFLSSSLLWTIILVSIAFYVLKTKFKVF